jgi:hypothetical protein
LDLAVEAPTWVIYAKTIPDPTAHLPGNLAKLGRRHVDALLNRFSRNIPLQAGISLVLIHKWPVNIGETVGSVGFFVVMLILGVTLLVLVLTPTLGRRGERGDAAA